MLQVVCPPEVGRWRRPTVRRAPLLGRVFASPGLCVFTVPVVFTAVVNPTPLGFCTRTSGGSPPFPPPPHGRAGGAGAAAWVAPGRARI